jgi:hypothetical protein
MDVRSVIQTNFITVVHMYKCIRYEYVSLCVLVLSENKICVMWDSMTRKEAV